MKLETEAELVQYPALCALVICAFVEEFFGQSQRLKGPSIPFALQVLPMVIHRETVNALSRRHYIGGLQLALAENKTLILDLQERMEEATDLTMSALNISFASGVLGYDKDRGQLIPKKPVRFLSANNEIREIISTAKRLGYAFSSINAEQLCALLRIHF
jgi:hypothetical protein